MEAPHPCPHVRAIEDETKDYNDRKKIAFNGLSKKQILEIEEKIRIGLQDEQVLARKAKANAASKKYHLNIQSFSETSTAKKSSNTVDTKLKNYMK